jgi:hypothetical protein
MGQLDISLKTRWVIFDGGDGERYQVLHHNFMSNIWEWEEVVFWISQHIKDNLHSLARAYQRRKRYGN